MDLGGGELDLSGMVRDELAQTPGTHGSPPHRALGPLGRQTVGLPTHMDDVHGIPGGHRGGEGERGRRRRRREKEKKEEEVALVWLVWAACLAPGWLVVCVCVSFFCLLVLPGCLFVVV